MEWTGLCGELVATAYNLVRMSRLIAEEEAKVPIVALPSLGKVRLSDLVRSEYDGFAALDNENQAK